MIALRPYQEEAVQKIEETFKSRKSQYIELPTGAGKTITFLSLTVKYSKTLVIVPSRELLHQVYETALLFYHKSEISRKGANYDENIEKLHICIINSIRGQYLDWLVGEGFDLVVIDECHHVQANSYRRIYHALEENDDPFFLGVTATPDRIDGKLIKDLLGSCSYRKDIAELIHQGYLSDVEGYSIKTKIDLSDIDDHNGDFSVGQLFKTLCTDARNKLILSTYKENLSDRKSLIFCINIEHSKIISNLLNENGIPCMHIDGTMNGSQRKTILDTFRNGGISCLSNCQLLTEGFDESSIDGIILARPTRSSSLFRQMVGRGLRNFPNKKNCKVIDIVDMHKNLAGFNNLLTEDKYREIESFKTFRDIELHLDKEIHEALEFVIQKTDLLNIKGYNQKEATQSIYNYLENNNIPYINPVSFEEGSFMVWLNELKKECYGLYQKA